MTQRPVVVPGTRGPSESAREGLPDGWYSVGIANGEFRYECVLNDRGSSLVVMYSGFCGGWSVFHRTPYRRELLPFFEDQIFTDAAGAIMAAVLELATHRM